MHRFPAVFAFAFLVSAQASAQSVAMPDRVRQFDADLTSLERFYPIDWSTPGCARFERFFEQRKADLGKIERSTLDVDGTIDLDLLMNYIQKREDDIALTRARNAEMKTFVPFSDEAASLEEARIAMHPGTPEESAKVLQKLVDQAKAAQERFEKALKSNEKPGASLCLRASQRLDLISRTLSRWYGEFDGYVPSFDWWCKKPWADLKAALTAYSKDLRQRGAGFVEGQDPPIIGDPIGREAYIREMKTELLDMTPEQMIARAQKEADFCHAELKKAAREMGFGDDWKKALAKTKEDHAEPGDQPATIAKIENEAIDFVTSRNLVTVEPIIRETWDWTMTPTEDEKTWPYPTYGFYKVMVPYATEDMDETTKEEVFRGNGIHFLHNVVPHELIPGHHLQGLMASKYVSYRRRFETPFLVEGWAFYWEMRLYDLGWSKSPEDRIGQLFWRLHRCARVIVSTKFHLGKMTPQQMIDYLITEVGHEPAMARAEVRRYLAGGYEPLYQCAYQVGALALMDLHDEIVTKGGMSEKLFHDTILRQGSIPVSLIARKLRSVLKSG